MPSNKTPAPRPQPAPQKRRGWTDKHGRPELVMPDSIANGSVDLETLDKQPPTKK